MSRKTLDKEKVKALVLEALSKDLEAITEAAKNAARVATDEQHKAESKYDTFSLESSYLARGQAERVEQLRSALDRFTLLPLKKLHAKSPIVLSALVELKEERGETRWIFIGPSAGGVDVELEGKTITILTSSSPLGKLLIGKKQGDGFEAKMGPLPEQFKIVSVR